MRVGWLVGNNCEGLRLIGGHFCVSSCYDVSVERPILRIMSNRY